MGIINTVNISSPGNVPVDGDILEITYSEGHTVRRVYSSRTLNIDASPIRKISVGSFLDRMEVAGKLYIIYKLIDNAKNAPTPDYTLYAAIENLKQRSYIDLDEPRLKPTIEALGLYTAEELVTLFEDGIEAEEV